MPFEVQIVSSLQGAILTSPLLIAVSIFLARWLILIFIGFGLVLLSSKQATHRHAVWEGLWAAALTLTLTAIVAYLVQRTRPFLALPDPFYVITGLIPGPLNTSFPSGHTGTSVTMAAAIFFANRRLGAVAFACALLIAFGRIAVGVHYPSDILGGIVVGLVSFFLVRFFHQQIRTRDISASARHHHHT